jgi:hypothetical protein
MGATWIDRLRSWIMLGPPVIQQGSSGEAVTNWQHIIGITPSDGEFGPITAAATRSWQSARGIEPDAVVGPLTWKAALREAPARVTGNVPASGGEMQPLPPGTKPLPQSVANAPAITAFAVELVHTPDAYPMGSITSRNFGDKTVLGRIEKHTWTHKAGKLVTGLNPPIRGATLYLAPEGAAFAGDRYQQTTKFNGDVASFVGEFAGEFAGEYSSQTADRLYSSDENVPDLQEIIVAGPLPFVHSVSSVGADNDKRAFAAPNFGDDKRSFAAPNFGSDRYRKKRGLPTF